MRESKGSSDHDELSLDACDGRLLVGRPRQPREFFCARRLPARCLRTRSRTAASMATRHGCTRLRAGVDEARLPADRAGAAGTFDGFERQRCVGRSLEARLALEVSACARVYQQALSRGSDKYHHIIKKS